MFVFRKFYFSTLKVLINSYTILRKYTRSRWETFPMVGQMVKRLPAMRETWVQSLGREDPLEKEMATHSSTLA